MTVSKASDWAIHNFGTAMYRIAYRVVALVSRNCIVSWEKNFVAALSVNYDLLFNSTDKHNSKADLTT